MKKRIVLCLLVLALLPVTGCTQKKNAEPLTVTLWHDYGGEVDSPLNDLNERFNSTVGDTDAESFKVTIPADTTLPWGTADTTTALPYYVESHLKFGKHLTVAVTNDGANTMKYTVGGTTLTLAYTLGGDKNFDTVTPVAYDTVNDRGVEKTLTVSVAGDDWNTAVVGEYTDTLTFTVDVLP